MAITQTLTEFTADPPSTADPTDFDARASATLADMADMVPELNTWSGQVNTLAGEVSSAASAAAASATAADASADAVLAQGSTADAWSSGTTYILYEVAIGSNGRAYRSVQAVNLNHDPTTDVGTWWIPLNPDPLLAALLLMSGDLYPGWDMQAQGPVGAYPPSDPSKPAALVWSNGVERYRVTYTWGTSGGAINAPLTVVLEYSRDAGASYAALTADNKATITYSDSGAVIATAWSPA